jgi:antirestriction protein ArdC
LNYFLTFKQLKELGGKVIKGEKAHIVVFWKWVDEENEETGETVKRAFLRYHMVFNIAQCANIPNNKIPVVERPNNPIAECEEIVKAMQMRPKIQHKAQKAYYHPIMDYVNMPRIKSFKDSASYYGALFHELVHSTGHANRLNRKEVMDSKPYGSEPYSIEELTAEIGACYLKSQAGLAMEIVNSTAYIQGWLERLKNDKRFIVYASVQAQKAVDYILNTKPEEIASSIKEDSSVPA